MRVLKMLTVPVLAVSLVACQTTRPNSEGTITPGQPSNGAVGAVIGGIAGGFLGSQFGEGSGKTVATVSGALLGVWAGNQIANSMTQQDVSYYEEATTKAQTAPIGQTVEWYNPETANKGTVTKTQEGYVKDGRYCREFQQTVTIDSQTERAYGTACRQPDGSWEIVGTK